MLAHSAAIGNERLQRQNALLVLQAGIGNERMLRRNELLALQAGIGNERLLRRNALLALQAETLSGPFSARKSRQRKVKDETLNAREI